MICKKNHSAIQNIMEDIPYDQGGLGRHKCAACAYEKGYEDGKNRRTKLDIDSLLKSLPDSQAARQRHKSPQVAYARLDMKMELMPLIKIK